MTADENSRARPGSRRRLAAGRLGAVALGLLVLVVHDVGYLTSQSFWTDETWVAATTRFSLSRLPLTTSSTPIGWSVLLRLVTVSGTEVSRLLPLFFAGAAVVTACWLGHGLGWRPGAPRPSPGSRPGRPCCWPPACWCATT